MRSRLLYIPLFLLVPALRAAEPEDVQFQRVVKRTATAVKQLEITQMVGQVLQKGADMGPGSGWFKPSESRYDWKWLSSRHGGKERISPKEFNGPPELFARLDRDRNGVITAADLDWSDSSPYFRQFMQARQWLRMR